MTVTELKNAIKDGNIGGAYVFAGEEDYLKKYYLGLIRDIVCPDEAFSLFNYSVFDGGEIDFPAIAEAIKSPPMMGDFKLIEWRYPDLDSLSESEKKKLSELAELCTEYPYAVLIFLTSEDGFDAGSAKRPSKLAARLKDKFKLILFEKSTDAQLMGWLKKHFDAEGIGVSAATISALIFRSGHSMQILKNEVSKLSAYAKANSLTALTEAEVKLVAAPTLECDAFALSTAITDKNREKAFLALMDMKRRRIEAGAVIATLSRAFGELVTVSMLLDEGRDVKVIEAALGWNPYKIKICVNSARKWGTARLVAAEARLREMDAASKSGGVIGFTPIEIFVSSYL